MDECIFCKIVKGELPCAKVYENDRVLAIRDINPAAPVHVVIMPKWHMRDLLQVAETPNGLIANILDAAAAIAKAEGVFESGFRLISNTGPDAGQSVPHFHMHLLGGKQLNAELG